MNKSDSSFLRQLHVVMVKSRFPENVGMAARACANMGAQNICLVDPELWDIEKARPLATAKGQNILESIQRVTTLPEALSSHALVVGATARTGGWRRELLSPEQAAHEIVAVLQEGESVALVMGPEDRGLNNEEIECCQRLVTIPTDGASSLNVAQSVLLLLYECLKAALPKASVVHAPTVHEGDGENTSRRISAEDQARLYEKLKEMLLHIDYLHGDNPDYFLMPLRRFLGRVGLRRHEYDALMGVCRQVKNKCVK